MTRLSDSLHGLADRAPLDGVSVSTVAATRRINRGRRLRAAANATAGVGAAAVIALAAVNPGMTSDAKDAATGLESSADGNREAAPAFDAAGSGQLAWGLCGTYPFEGEVPMASDAFTLTLGEIGGEVEQGSTVDAELAVTFPEDRESGYTSFGSAFMVLWNGMVVGTGQGSNDIGIQDLSSGTASWDEQVDLVNCWDGSPLPAGGYELVAYQDFYADAVTDPVEPIDPVEPAEPTVAPATEPEGEPAVDPATSPDDAGTPDASGSSTASAPDPGDTGIVGPAADGQAERAVSNHVKLVIAGDVPDDPFGQYLGQPTPFEAYPDDYLTPDMARAEFAARTNLAPWDMAKGSQRVLKTGDSLTDGDPNSWLESYYGCSADGTTQPSFPQTTASWPLISVNASLPGAIDLSYGWVVDDNPAVDFTVTNTSDFTLPGFWGQPNTSLYLVKDGKVVASSYLASTDPNGYNLTTTGTSTNGLLAPDGSLGGTYLWREVSGCWTGDSQLSVNPGTYTILSVQDLYLDSGATYSAGGIGLPDVAVDDVARSYVEQGEASAGSVGIEEPAIQNSTTGGAKIAIAPAPGEGTYNYVSLQVWTSLGQVTIK